MPGLLNSPGIFVCERIMINRIRAFPDGTVEYHFDDKVVTEGKDGNSITRIKIYNKKDTYGGFDRIPNLWGHSSQHISHGIFKNI
jgi:hypothetical protein